MKYEVSRVNIYGLEGGFRSDRYIIIIACELQTYFRPSLHGGREATTGNTSAVRRLAF